MTYREKIQEISKQLSTIYDDAEWLRDLATEDEKQPWNDLRRLTREAQQKMYKLDYSLNEARAAMEV